MTSPYARFEHFPRQPLKFRFTRREMLNNVAVTIEVARGEQQGGYGLKLSQLGLLPDAELLSLVPQMVPGCSIFTSDGHVCALLPDKTRALVLFEKDDVLLAVFNRFNGYFRLQDAAAGLQFATGWAQERCIALTRGLFLHLVRLRVCTPKPEEHV